MPDELPPIPNTYQQPQGVISSRQKKWIFAGIIALAAVLMILSAHSSNSGSTRKAQFVGPMPKQTIVEPKPRPRIASEDPEYHPLGGGYAAPVQPQQTEQDRLREEQIQYEQKAAFEDSLVPRPVQESQTTKGESEVSNKEARAFVSDKGAATEQGKPAAAPTLDFDHSQPLYTLPEGTIIDCALVNELNGEFAGPVQVQVSDDILAPGTRTLLIPQGARILGDTNKVSGFGQQRLAVAFHRILIGTGPGMYSVSLDKNTPGLDQEGATALHDKVNGHYFQIFGASLAIGAIGGLAQIGNGYTGFGYDPSVQFRNGISQSMAQSSDQVLSRFLNRLPTITIRPGTRVVVYLTGDLQVPEYRANDL